MFKLLISIHKGCQFTRKVREIEVLWSYFCSDLNLFLFEALYLFMLEQYYYAQLHNYSLFSVNSPSLGIPTYVLLPLLPLPWIQCSVFVRLRQEFPLGSFVAFRSADQKVLNFARGYELD